MMICVISGSLQETVDYRLRKSGFQVLHILDPQVIETSIRQFKPAMILIASDSVAYDSMEPLMTIKNRHADLPVLTFPAPVDGFVDDILKESLSLSAGSTVTGPETSTWTGG